MTSKHDRPEPTKLYRELTQWLERIGAAVPPAAHGSAAAGRTDEAITKRLAELVAADNQLQELLDDPDAREANSEPAERAFRGLTPISNRLIRTGAEISIDEPDQHHVPAHRPVPDRHAATGKWTARTWDRLERPGATAHRRRRGPRPENQRIRRNAAALRVAGQTHHDAPERGGVALGQANHRRRTEPDLVRQTHHRLRPDRATPASPSAASLRPSQPRRSGSRMVHDGHATQINTNIITAMDLWAPNHPHQTTLWSSVVKLNHEYFESLVAHAVPLDERAVAALGHSALALDIYTWLAQRLHRVKRGRQELVPWTALLKQFGGGYSRVRAFREFFQKQLAAVHTQYPAARFEADRKGLWIRNSPPPITRIGVTIDGTTEEVPSPGSIDIRPEARVSVHNPGENSSYPRTIGGAFHVRSVALSTYDRWRKPIGNL